MAVILFLQVEVAPIRIQVRSVPAMERDAPPRFCVVVNYLLYGVVGFIQAEAPRKLAHSLPHCLFEIPEVNVDVSRIADQTVDRVEQDVRMYGAPVLYWHVTTPFVYRADANQPSSILHHVLRDITNYDLLLPL